MNKDTSLNVFDKQDLDGTQNKTLRAFKFAVPPAPKEGTPEVDFHVTEKFEEFCLDFNHEKGTWKSVRSEGTIGLIH